MRINQRVSGGNNLSTFDSTKRHELSWERCSVCRADRRGEPPAGLRELKRESRQCLLDPDCVRGLNYSCGSAHVKSSWTSTTQGRAQIKQCIRGQCPQCTWRNTPQLISLLFLDKQRTRLPESCMILLQSHELLEQPLFVGFPRYLPFFFF